MKTYEAIVVDRKVLEALAGQYERRKAGRSGEGKQRMLLKAEDFLDAISASEGLPRAQALEQLARAERAGWIRLQYHRRDRTLLQEIELVPGGEQDLFAALELLAPTRRRQAWKELFLRFRSTRMPAGIRPEWENWCDNLATNAAIGAVKSPFRWKELDSGEDLLRILAGALNWPGESLIRFASCVLCGESKRLEQLAPRLCEALSQLSGGRITSLEELGLLRIPRVVLVHGPLELRLPAGVLNMGLLRAPVWISESDLQAALSVSTVASRLLTVENETTMQELAKLQSGTLLVHTSYPSSAVLTLLRLLPPELPAWHFGDSDPAGFDILRVLRDRTGRQIAPLHMRFRPNSPKTALSVEDLQILARVEGHPLMADVQKEISAFRTFGEKGEFEQESLGWPLPQWPFY
jgi:hypothetical protein